MWLKERGYLSFRKDKPESLEDMNPESRVFVLDPGRFYIHLEGKYSNGSVKMSDYNTLRHKLKDELLSMTFDGEKVIKSVFFKEELYNGDMFDRAPDLVVLSYEGFDMKGSINKTELAGNSFLTGGHTRDNAVFFINREINSKDVNIVDVGPTIMSLMGLSGSFDGKCLI